MRETLQLWKSHRYTMTKFMEDYTCEATIAGLTRNTRLARLEKAFSAPSVSAALHEDLRQGAIIHRIASELRKLIATVQEFGSEDDNSSDFEDFDFERIIGALAEKAPTWYTLLQSLCLNERQFKKQESYSGSLKNKKASVQNIIFLITAVVCHSRARKRSNFLLKRLGAYLHVNGTKRRVVDLLAVFGVCPTSKHVVKGLDEVAEAEKASGDGSSCIESSNDNRLIPL